MNEVTSRRLTRVLLILTPITFNLLSVTFEYPDISRESAGYVLERFGAGGVGRVPTWYGFVPTAVLLVPLVVLAFGYWRTMDAKRASPSISASP
jgi:hypothetical protein